MKKNKISLNLSLTRETLKKQLGFTLFELLVSISIIAIMTALASVAFSGAQKKARDSRRVQDMKLIQTAAEQYYSQNTYLYPTNYTAGTAWTPSGSTATAVLESFPTDPKNTAPYVYSCRGTCNTAGYCLCARVENTSNGNSTNNCTTFTAPSATTNYFCVKNQQ